MAEPKYVTLAEVKEMLNAEAEQRELLPTQKAAVGHANAVCPLSTEQANEMLDKLMALGFIPEPVAYKIVDLLPKYPNDVHAIFSKERIALEADQIDNILSVVNDF